VSDTDGKGTPVYICCLPKFPLNIFYFSYIMREMARSGHIKSLYRGIRERSSDFRYETFAVQYLPIPPLDEQNAIVDYINSKTAKIDGLIADLSAQIEKLKEYKQRLIADAVTGQIDVRK
ncbi:MAG: restriction endonuclease subunit S, partial [Muribaculum sp.]|nr:restriction endonuclease subunit S [Muribaculum sp.]